jgi:hypothetical protein
MEKGGLLRRRVDGCRVKDAFESIDVAKIKRRNIHPVFRGSLQGQCSLCGLLLKQTLGDKRRAGNWTLGDTRHRSPNLWPSCEIEPDNIQVSIVIWLGVDQLEEIAV